MAKKSGCTYMRSKGKCLSKKAYMSKRRSAAKKIAKAFKKKSKKSKK